MARKRDKNGNPIPYMRGGVIYEHIYEIELYSESDNARFDEVYQICQDIYYQADKAYIYHDKDIKEDGSLKKPHYHLLIVFPREKSINKLSKETGVPLNLIKWKAYLDLSVQYLVHQNNPEKYQYDVEDIHGDVNYWWLMFVGGTFNGNARSNVSTIINWVYSHKGHITYYDVFRYAFEHYLLKEYKQYYPQIKDIMNQ